MNIETTSIITYISKVNKHACIYNSKLCTSGTVYYCIL